MEKIEKRSRRRLKIWNVRSSQIIKVNYCTQGLQNKNVLNNEQNAWNAFARQEVRTCKGICGQLQREWCGGQVKAFIMLKDINTEVKEDWLWCNPKKEEAWLGCCKQLWTALWGNELMPSINTCHTCGKSARSTEELDNGLNWGLNIELCKWACGNCCFPLEVWSVPANRSPPRRTEHCM